MVAESAPLESLRSVWIIYMALIGFWFNLSKKNWLKLNQSIIGSNGLKCSFWFYNNKNIMEYWRISQTDMEIHKGGTVDLLNKCRCNYSSYSHSSIPSSPDSMFHSCSKCTHCALQDAVNINPTGFWKRLQLNWRWSCDTHISTLSLSLNPQKVQSK